MRVFHKYGVVLLLLLLMLFVSGVSVECVNAAETDTTWQNAYEYSLDTENRIITLNKYIGLDTDLIVYGSAVIEGVKYQTALKSAGSYYGGIWYDKRANIEVLEFYDPVKLPADCSYMFYGCSSLTSLNVSKFDTTGVTNMTGMFYGCSGLTDLNLASFSITTSNCTDLLTGATGLTLLNTPARTISSIALPVSMKELDCSTGALGAETSTLTSGQSVSKALVVGAITHSWDISMNNDGSIMAYLFNTGLLYITGSGELLDWAGSTGASDAAENVSTYSSAFVCSDIAKFTNTLEDNKVIPTQWRQYKIVPWAFKDIRDSITEVVFEGDIDGKTAFMFSYIKSVRAIDFSRATVNTTQAYYAFTECINLFHIIGIKNYTLLDTWPSALASTFRSCSSLKELDLSHWRTGNMHTLNYTFMGCTSLTYLNLSGWDTSNVEDMACTFHSCASLEEIDISHFDTSKVTTFYGTFSMYGHNDNKLKTIKLGDFGSDIATNFSWLFYNCQQLENLEFTSFNTKANERMDNMFAYCKSLNELDLRSFNTSKVTNMSSMFYECSSLSSINLSGFDTSNVTNMACMFQFCTSLVELNLRNFNTENVTNMTCMFSMYTRPNSLKSLNVSSFKTSKATNISYMFYGCNKLSELDLSNFSISSTINVKDLLYNCKSLHCLKAPSNCSADVKLPIAMRELKLATNSIGSDVYDSLPKVQSESKILIKGLHSCDENHVCKICGYRGYLFEYSSNSYCTADASYTWDISKDQNGSVNAYLFTNGLLYVTGSGEMIDWQASAACNSSSRSISTRTTGVTADVYTPTKIRVRKSYTPTKWASEKMVPWSFKDIRDKIKTVYFKGNFSGSAACLFGSCANLTRVDLKEYNGKLNNLALLFISDRKLSEIDGIENLDTSNVTTMYCMFRTCSSLTVLDVSNFNTSKVTNMSNMFYNCSGVTELSVRNFNTNKVTDMSNMFDSCSSLTSLDVSNFNTSKVTDMSSMFRNCSSLSSLDLSSFNTSNVTSMCDMFYDCSGLTSLTVSSFNTSNVTNMSSMFESCSSLTSLDLGNFDTRNVTNMYTMFENCSSLASLNVSNFTTSNIPNMSYMFCNCSSLSSLDLSSFDTSNVTYMGYMFQNCSSLSSLDLSSFNTSNVTSMCDMFYDCSSLTSLDLSNFNTGNVVYMQGVFGNCSSLTSLDLSNFDTSKVTDMSSMFYGCSSLTSLDLSNFDTRNVTNMPGMFGNCSSLSSLTVRSFDTSKVNNMIHMFDGCSNLTSLDLSNFDMSKVTNVMYMLTNCTSLHYLKTPINNTLDIALQVTLYEFNKASNIVATTGVPAILAGQTVSKDLVTNSHDWDGPLDTECNICGFQRSAQSSFVYNEVTYNLADALHNWDISKSQNGSVKAFLFNDGLLYITGNGKLIDWQISASYNDAVDNVSTNSNPITYEIFGYDEKTIHPKATYTPANWVVEKIVPWSFVDIKDTINCVAFDGTITGSMSFMFAGLENLTTVDFTNCTCSAHGMVLTFCSCSSLREIKSIHNLDVSNSFSFAHTFRLCSSLQELDLSQFDTSKAEYMQSMFYNCSSLTSLDVSKFDTRLVTKMHGMFYGCSSLTSLDVSKFNTKLVDNMNCMFYNCNKLTNLDVSNFDTSNVKNMSFMFWGCSNLSSLDVSKFDTSNVTTLLSMFKNCSKLTNLDVANWNTSAVTDMSSMFYGCSKLTSIDVSKFKTSSVTSMKEMFRECSGLTNLNVSKFATGSVTDMGWMFYKCSGLLNLDLSNFDTSSVSTVRSMFNGCSKLTSLNLSSFDMFNVANVNYMLTGCSSLHYLKAPINNTLNISLPSTFYDFNKSANVIFRVGIESIASNQAVSKNLVTHKHTYNSERVCTICGYVNTLLVTLDGKDYYSDQATHIWDISKAQDCSVVAYLFSDGLLYVTGTGEMIDWRYSAAYNDEENNVSTNDNSIYYPVYTTGDVFDNSYTALITYVPANWLANKMVPWGFVDIKSLIKVVYCDGNFSGSMSCMFAGLSELTKVNLTKYKGKPTSSNKVLADCTSLIKIDGLNTIDTSNVTNMTGMFAGCSSMTSLDLSSFDTSNVTYMSLMFYGCSSLTSLALSSFDTSSVTDMYGMFAMCSSLIHLDLSNFNTSKVTNMYGMFYNCSSITAVDLSNFDTSNVTNMWSMFYECSGLTSLNLSNFNTENVTDMSGMFYDCSGLTSLDLSSFDMSKVTGAEEMITGMNSLATLNTPKNCPLSVALPYKMYNIDNVSYTSIPNLTTSIELTKDPKFDYKVSIPTNVVLMADVEDGDGIDSLTRFTASPNIIVHGSAGNMKLAIKSHDVNDNAGEMTLRDGDNTMPCKMKFTDTDSCIFDLYTDRLTAEQKQDASGDGLLIPLELLATGLNTTGCYEGSLEFEFSRIP